VEHGGTNVRRERRRESPPRNDERTRKPIQLHDAGRGSPVLRHCQAKRSLATGRLCKDCSTSAAGLDDRGTVCRGRFVPSSRGFTSNRGPGLRGSVRRGLTGRLLVTHVLRRTERPGVQVPPPPASLGLPRFLRGNGGASSGHTVPIARLGSCVERCPAASAPDHSGARSADCPASSHRLLGSSVAGRALIVTGDCSPVHVSEPITESREHV